MIKKYTKKIMKAMKDTSDKNSQKKQITRILKDLEGRIREKAYLDGFQDGCNGTEDEDTDDWEWWK